MRGLQVSRTSFSLRVMIQMWARKAQEQQVDINALSLNLERAKWIIKYPEQRNKHLEDQQAIMELQNIRENRQVAQRRRVELTSLEQEINVDRES